eukprot:Rhum_TRINITY_DN21118_c0_g1::Rhum_TRINITY_DN21118_c0_g1_i1::g.173244::m.173244
MGASGSSAQDGGSSKTSSYHYGGKHHLDVYAAESVDGQEAKLNEEFEVWCSENYVGDEEKRRKKELLDQHIIKVKKAHRMLEAVAKIEQDGLYSAADAMPSANLSFEDWQQEEMLKLIKRRETAMGHDLARPDLNRRSYYPKMWHFLSTPTPKASLEHAAVEPGHYPKRKFYYPVTDFAMLPTPDTVSEEEEMLKQAWRTRQCKSTYQWFTTGGSIALGVALLFRTKLNPQIVIGSGMFLGYMADAQVTAWHAVDKERDYLDYIVAKNVWFAKNRPDVFSIGNYGAHEVVPFRETPALSAGRADTHGLFKGTHGTA